DKAEPFFIKTLEIYKKTLGADHEYYKMALQSTIDFFEEAKNYEKAAFYSKETLANVLKKDGENSQEYAIALNNIGLFYHEARQYNVAEEYFLKSVKIM